MKKCILVVVIALFYIFTSINVLLAAPNTWTRKNDFGGGGRDNAVGFSIGSKGYIGTGDYGNGAKKDFWEYDPVVETWTQKADFGGVARKDAVGFSIGSKGYIGTGSTLYDKKDFWEYDPSANTWTQKADFGGEARGNAVGFSIGNKGYVGTGNGDGDYSDFWEYNPALNIWTRKADFGGGARNEAVGFSIGSKGYIGTGTTGSRFKDFWEYDPSLNTWTRKADFGGIARNTAVGFSIGSKGYIGMGYSGSSGTQKDFWAYDPVTDTWIQKSDFGGGQRRLAVGFSIGSKGYIGTGYEDKKDFWEYNMSRDSIYAVIQNCLANPSDSVCSDSDNVLESINEDTVFREIRHTIIRSKFIISPWYDGDWQNQITNSSDTSFNTVRKGVPDPTDKFEVISFVDETEGPVCGTENQKSYFFTYTTKYSLGKHAVILDDWITYLKAITLDYNRPIDTLTIFSHATAGDVEMSEAFHLTEETAPLFSRLRNENILAPNATILLFACEAGKGEAGQRFVQIVANATGAKVYANTEYTGNPRGIASTQDWTLDVEKDPQDTTPDQFTFADQTNVGLDAVLTSNAIAISGIDAAAIISIKGGTYAINNGAYTSAVGTLGNGDIVTVKLTSAASYATMTNAILTIGGTSNTFSVTTEAAPCDTTPDTLIFIDQTGVGLNQMIASNTLTVSGITCASPISITGGTYSVNGEAYTSANGTVNNGDTVTVRQTSSASNSTTTYTTLTIGGVSDTFSVTTLPDTIPDQFTFTDRTDMPLTTWITSNTITVAGINTATPISITGGAYSINNGSYITTNSTVNNGNIVTVKNHSSASYSTTTNTILTIGGVSDTFSVTTLVDATPPVVNPSASTGNYTGSQTITISTEAGAIIYYTRDGSDPVTNPNGTRQSFTGSGDIPVTATTTLKYYAIDTAGNPSAVQTQVYTISYPLTVSKSGNGSGTITSNPSGIACGGDCSENYTSGTSVTMTATPASGSIFTGWSGGGCTGTGTCKADRC